MPTSPQKKNRARFKKRVGFTLIETLLVIVLIGILFTVFARRSSNLFRASVQSSVRRYAALVRFAYDQSVLTGQVHRIVLNLDEQVWTVEAAAPGALPIDKAKEGLLPESLREEDRVQEKSEFKPAIKSLVTALPKGVQLVRVESWRTGEAPVTKGQVSIYAFPGGFIDKATVTLAEAGKNIPQVFKVTTQSLTGRVQVEAENQQP